MTNGDKIRSMTDEELQKWLCSIMTVDHGHTQGAVLVWVYARAQNCAGVDG